MILKDGKVLIGKRKGAHGAKNPRCHFGHQPIVVMVRRLAAGGGSHERTRLRNGDSRGILALSRANTGCQTSINGLTVDPDSGL
jgi:hypothetical protein